MPQVQVIQPIQQQPKRLRVAAYARVSSDSTDQLNSLSVQVDYYTHLIQENPNWDFAGIYADEGITGTSTKHREQFNRLLDDCRAGLIDRVLVKSASRFARNTADALASVREMKSLGVTVVFEKEGFDTETANGEMILSMICATAQEESLSISQNTKWGIRKKMHDGTYITSLTPFGYKKINRQLFPDEKEAATVKEIFNLFLNGFSTAEIANHLNTNHPKPDVIWRSASVRFILRNEKYIGDSLFQKNYTPDTLPLKSCCNTGQLPKYYVEGTHPGIISKDEFERVQSLLTQKNINSTNSRACILSKVVFCALCGHVCSRKVRKSQTFVWCCRTHLQSAALCPLKPVSETEIQQAFLSVYNKLQANQSYILQPIIDTLLQLRFLQEQANSARQTARDDVQRLAKQRHNLTRIHTLGYIQDCKKRKIDLILTKSISRFARNTLDSIQYVRMLKALGIAVIFEKENINTSTMNSEMILTVLSAFAQAESESISQNVARGKRMGFRQGKFPFPYRQILGYRKGSDGKPEIIPEEAEVIRMIFNSYLQGASLQTIKKRLEADGVLTARGNKKWSSESVQRILQNEKYCGDVLLQKTFIEDVLTGVSKKNTGQLPQYYIENNHEGIVTKQTFREAQAEIARRNSKSATNHRKRHRGRYNSKYALSERLVCGDCGSSYKRVTWSIHGRKQIVWRCVNRLEYGTKFCSNSPSIPETELHQAILKAVQNLAAKFTGEVADQLNGILHQIEVGESLTPQLQAQLEQNQQEFDHLLEMSLDFDENTPFLDDKLKRLSDKIKQLKTAITQSSVNSQTPSTPTNPITAKDLLITEYDDMLTARIIEKIIVKSRQDLEIIFIGGYTQQISLQ